MSAERDAIDALEDILENMKLATRFMAASATVEDLEGDPKTRRSTWNSSSRPSESGSPRWNLGFGRC